jgi:signal transduction histidine kinase
MLSFARVSQFSGSDRREQFFESLRQERNARPVLSVLLVVFGYYIGTLIGFALTPQREPISIYWPPNAILLAALLLSPRKRWAILLLAVLPIHLLVQLSRGIPWETSFGWYLGNAGEALLGAYLITEVQEARASFERVRGLVVFLAFGVIGAPLLTSFIDAGTVVITGWGKDYWLLWTTRLLSNMLAELTLVPAIVLFYFYGVEWIRRATIAKYLEAALLITSVFLVIMLAFGIGRFEHGHIRFFYMLLPILLWASLRFEFGGLSATLVAVSLIVSWGAIKGLGPFSAISSADVMALQVLLCMIALPFMFLGAVLTQQRNTARALRDSRARLIGSQEQERGRIARELHDGVGQSLALVEIEMAQWQQESDPPTKAKLQALSQKLSDIANVTHELSHGLHPSHLEYLGLAGALNKLCHDVGQDLLIEVKCVLADPPKQLDLDVSLSLYRVAQEALHNMAKYSRAHNVELRLQVTAGSLHMNIKDDGVGFAEQGGPAAGIGMETMRERMQLVGGELSVNSAPMKGTSVHASVPLNRAA